MCQQEVVDAVKSVLASTFTTTSVVADRVPLEYPDSETNLKPPKIDPITKHHQRYIATFFPTQSLNSLEIGTPTNVRWREDGVFFCWVMLPITSNSDEGRELARRLSFAFLGRQVGEVCFESRIAGAVVDDWDSNWKRISLGFNYSFDFLMQSA